MFHRAAYKSLYSRSTATRAAGLMRRVIHSAGFPRGAGTPQNERREALDRLADADLQHGNHSAAELLSERAASLLRS